MFFDMMDQLSSLFMTSVILLTCVLTWLQRRKEKSGEGKKTRKKRGPVPELRFVTETDPDSRTETLKRFEQPEWWYAQSFNWGEKIR